MKIHKFEPEHIEQFHFMMSGRQIPIVGTQLPKLGFIVLEGEVPVCAGFLREVEGGLYFFDSLISNKNLNSETRATGMDLLWSQIIAETPSSSVIGFTTDAGTLQRAKSLGFKEASFSVLSLNRGAQSHS